jgi:hypothetical protein
VSLRKSGYLMPIAATRHRTPTSAARPGGIIEKEPARRIRTDAQTRSCSLGDDFRGRTGDGCEKPIETTFTGDEFQAPFAVLLQEFVVTLGDTEYVVDW